MTAPHDGARGDARKAHAEECEALAAAMPAPVIDAAHIEHEHPTLTIRKPEIHTGPRHQTVDEATVSYLRNAARRVRDKRYWGSGVTALVADLLDDTAAAIERTQATQAPADAPDAAPVQSGAIGRLNEALAAAIDTRWTRPEHACDGTEQSCIENCPRPAYERMGLDDLRDDAVTAVERIVREHTDRALAEVEQRIASSVSPNFALKHDGTEDPLPAAYVDGLRDAIDIIHETRQEQGCGREALC